MNKYPGELSGGMQRRVGIARATISKPPLMLYDSPTGGLDPITAYHIMKMVIKQRDVRGATTMMLTYRVLDAFLPAHYRYDIRTKRLIRMSKLNDSTQFLVLRDGRLVFEGCEAATGLVDEPLHACFHRQAFRVTIMRTPPSKGIPNQADVDVTGQPKWSLRAVGPAQSHLLYVVQKHRASHPHYDFRLSSAASCSPGPFPKDLTKTGALRHFVGLRHVHS